MLPLPIIAIILGLIEGITEFLPVSSTGHLILAGRWLGIDDARAHAFEIFIQLGAVLAVAWDRRATIARHAGQALRSRSSARLLAGVGVAFLPAAFTGLLFHAAIERNLYGELAVGSAMIVGALLIVLVERMRPPPTTTDLASVGWGQAIAVGIAQVASLFPGFSRSAATILGGLMVGMDRSVATEFSFLLAIPTLGAASLYSLAKELPHLGASDVPFFAIGLVVSFVSALIVVRAFLAYVRTRTLTPFAWYRLAAGLVVLIVWCL